LRDTEEAARVLRLQVQALERFSVGCETVKE
jgi:hypothetical protein